MPKLTPKEFVNLYSPFAKQVQLEQGIPYKAILT